MPSYEYVAGRFPRYDRSDGVEQFLVPTPRCNRCSLPISPEFKLATGVCAHCHADDPVDGVRLEGIVAAMLYIPRVRGYPHTEEIEQFKLTGAHSREFAEVLVHSLSERLPKARFASVALVPSSSEQAPKSGLKLVGTILSRRFRTPLVDGIRFTRAVSSQRSAGGREARRANVAGSMGLSETVPSGRTLVLDDVATTGFSLAEATRVLMGQGATSCFGAVVGRDARLDYLARVGALRAVED